MANRTENTEAHSDLFQPVSLGPHRLANRIIMAPLTRQRIFVVVHVHAGQLDLHQYSSAVTFAVRAAP